MILPPRRRRGTPQARRETSRSRIVDRWVDFSRSFSGPRASAYFLGGELIAPARPAITCSASIFAIIRACLIERHAALAAATMRAKLSATWGLTETGTTGLSGNRATTRQSYLSGG